METATQEGPALPARTVEDPAWPGWFFVDVTCAACGAVSQIHEQTDEMLGDLDPIDGRRLGVVWECPKCSAKNNLGGEAPKAPDTYIVECVKCSSTFAPSAVSEDADGNWTCPVCDTPQRDVHATDVATSTEAQA